MNLFKHHTKPESLPHYEDFKKHHYSNALEDYEVEDGDDGADGEYLDKSKVTKDNLPSIARRLSLALQYATDVIKGRWPEAEPVIMKDPRNWRLYKEAFGL